MKAQENSQRLNRIGSDKKSEQQIFNWSLIHSQKILCACSLLVAVVVLTTAFAETRSHAANRAKVATLTGHTVSGVVTNGRIAFVSSDVTGTQSDIYTMNPDGSDRKQLTFTNQGNESDPDWSPDGT